MSDGDTLMFGPDLIRLLSFTDLNTRVVLVGTALLGAACGIIGCFALLRKRALVGDALSHAALPGLCAAFLLVGSKSYSALLFGAMLSCLVGVAVISLLGGHRRISEDTVIGIVLSTFFAFGVCLSRYIQNVGGGEQAGLTNFIYGKAASMLTSDAVLTGVVCAVILFVAILCSKEFRLASFDPDYARTTGWSVKLIDALLMAAVVLTTVVGLQTVGVVLIIALLITPAATGRLWTEDLSAMVILSSVFGAVSALLGAAASALAPQLPTGPIIVLIAAVFFFTSLLVAPQRGLIVRGFRLFQFRRKIALQNFLRLIYEQVEAKKELRGEIDLTAIQAKEFGRFSFPRELRRASRAGYLENRSGRWHLTETGLPVAENVVHNHRLWELYLIRYADIAPSHVDQSADTLEHLLPTEVLQQLEQALSENGGMVPSPHSIGGHTHD